MKMKTKKKPDIMFEALKRVRKENREREIEMYGRPINYHKIYKNKKIYSRKNQRIDFSFISF